MDGIYYVEFGTSGGAGGGLVVLSSGKAHGGDLSYLYAGTYEENPNNFSAKVEVKHWKGPRNNIFGNVEKIDLVLSGKEVSAGTIKGQGHPVGAPQRQMVFEMNKLRDLA
ncbi:GrlR family regulatory protein [Desulfovibrio psychrotolerans]|uniref:Uncharacterized protein n=1 Tax=Desulfovibrio psychrotolerans TaxID=415242 RepID=A0A7J0BZ74_9BACT|nr:GrlR family regulatory protein [Desulfovibrio psychrotolerans]GFM38274.1 hypothetical protein DSM19430T_29580 [Desulfovibrio psychrotolerans]